jgi:DNA invertase Pin-like site-specific DNA recombinase
MRKTVAQLERDIIAERVKAGLRRAKENGKRMGRPAKKGGWARSL